MNIYFCHERNENSGLYVCEKSRGAAKYRYVCETGCDFCDVRTTTMHKNVREKPCVIDVDDTKLRKKYGLEYCDEDGEII